MPVIRTTSHRSRQKLEAAVEDLGREHYAWGKTWPVSGYFIISDAALSAAIGITGVSEIKRVPELHPCITA